MQQPASGMLSGGPLVLPHSLWETNRHQIP